MKTILLALALTITTLAADHEAPRLLGAKFVRVNEGQGMRWATLSFVHPGADHFDVRQISDGATNVTHLTQELRTKRGVIEYSAKLQGQTNIFTVRANENGVVSEWSNRIVVILGADKP